jgi:hypothetical protein
LRRACSHAPELDDVLREDAEPVLAAQQRHDRVSGLPVRWAAAERWCQRGDPSPLR